MFIGLYFLIVVLLSIPLWVFFVPILVLASVCGVFWRRTRFRNVCLAIVLLITVVSIPFVAVQALSRMDAERRLQSEFGVTFEPCTVAEYRLVPAGLGDTVEFWRLESADPNDYMQVISKNKLTKIAADSLFPPASMSDRPSWWPRSTQGYSVFDGQDSEGGGMEVWLPQDGSTVYLWRFLE